MRQLLLVLMLALVASPLAAQRKRGDRNKITVEELAEYKDESMLEVIPKARPMYFMPNGGGSSGMGEQTFQGLQAKLVIFVGTMEQGDSSALRFYKASDVQEVRYFKPASSLSPQTSGRDFVIQLIMKEPKKP